MSLVDCHDDGSEEWNCLCCARRILLRWPPTAMKLVLEAGDENVAHAGSKGDVSITGPRATLSVGEEDRSWLQVAGITWDAPQ